MLRTNERQVAGLNKPKDRLHFNAERFKASEGLDKAEIKERVKKAFAEPRKTSSSVEPAHAIYK